MEYFPQALNILAPMACSISVWLLLHHFSLPAKQQA
jgi:hypothetical protein